MISGDGFREDGRRRGELRRMEISGGVTKSGGHVELRQGNTQVVTTCSGPREPGRLNIRVRFYSAARQEPVSERKEQEYENLLFDIFDNIVLSESMMDVEVVVKEDGGSVLSVMINCVCLCLSYFGVPMVDTCCSVTLAGGCVDPSSAEDGQRVPVVTIAYLMNRRSIAYASSSGRISRNMLQAYVSDGIDSCGSVYKHFRDFLIPHVESV